MTNPPSVHLYHSSSCTFFVRGLSLCVIMLWFLQVVALTSCRFLSLWRDVPLCGQTHHGLLLHSSVSAPLGCFWFSWLLQVNLLWPFGSLSFCGYMLSFLLSKFLGDMWDVCLIFKEIAKLFSQAVVPLYLPTSRAPGGPPTCWHLVWLGLKF